MGVVLVHTFWTASSVLATQREDLAVLVSEREGNIERMAFLKKEWERRTFQAKVRWHCRARADAGRTCKCGAACAIQALPLLLMLGEKGAGTLVSRAD